MKIHENKEMHQPIQKIFPKQQCLSLCFEFSSLSFSKMLNDGVCIRYFKSLHALLLLRLEILIIFLFSKDIMRQK